MPRKRPFRKSTLGKHWHNVRRKFIRLKKELFQRLVLKRSRDKTVLLIVGCQRSGTTLLGNVLAKDLRTAVLQEQSCLTVDRSLRLRPYPEVVHRLQKFRASLVVVKPLVESQWTPEMLAAIPSSKALWMYRSFQDVVNSNVNRFSSQIEGLRQAVECTPPSWRSERVSPETRALLKQYYRPDMPPQDAAALGWYARNVLYFELGLHNHDNVRLCKYEHLVSQADKTIARLYGFLDVAPTRYSIASEIDCESLGLGKDAVISKDIYTHCSDLYARLEDCYLRGIAHIDTVNSSVQTI